MTITEFLTARYDEAEQIAKAASHEVALTEDRYSWASVDYWSEENDKHGALWSPERVMADIAAKRAIILLASKAEVVFPAGGGNDQIQINAAIDRAADGMQIIKHLASVYANHPDYQQEWKP